MNVLAEEETHTCSNILNTKAVFFQAASETPEEICLTH